MNARAWLAAATLLCSGCATARMAVPADVAGTSEELIISDRSSFSGALADESFNLGPYQIVDVDRQWNSQRTTTRDAVETVRASGGYHFKLTGADGDLSGHCETQNRGTDVELSEGWSARSLRATLGCRCKDPAASVELALEASTSALFEGVLKRAPEAAMVRAINEREGGSTTQDATGYRIDADGVALGAVDVLGKGRVWISKTLRGRARADLACVFAGLLLYQAPRDR